MASIQNDMRSSSVKTIIAISIIGMLPLVMSIFPTGVYALADAYSKGYKDATCDAVSCNGHGYDPTCPGDHSSEYCNNYRNGYAAGWNAAANANSNEQPTNPPPQQSQDNNNNNNNNQANNNNPTINIFPPK